MEQAIGLGFEDFWPAEPALRGQGAELIVRRRVPEEERETGGEGVIVKPAGQIMNIGIPRRAENGDVGGD